MPAHRDATAGSRPSSPALFGIPFIIVCVVGLSLSACENDWRDDLPDPVNRDLSEIKERDTLHVLTTYNSTSYFLYRGQAMGYEFDLLQAFADDQDLELKMHVLQTRDSIYQKLNSGEGDLVADRVVPLAADSAYIGFTNPLYSTRPMVVQRGESGDEALPESVDTVIHKATEGDEDAAIAELAEPDTAQQTSADTTGPDIPDSIAVRARLVQRPSELGGERIPLPYRSDYAGLLTEVSDTLSGDVHVVELDSVSSYEKVIRYVSSGEFEVTVSPRNLAKLTQSYFTNIHVQPAIGPTHDVAWAVRKNAPELMSALNAWIEENRDGQLFNAAYQRYFVDRRGYLERTQSEYLSGETGVLSEYDNLFRTYSDTLGWDWRLLASQAYQESRFQPRARSWAGAAGLLQLMPPTAREFGVANVYDPEQNVAGAVRFLLWLTEYWNDKIEDEDERMKFILASYNTGHGHVEDARRLAEKNGDSTTSWAEVAYWLLQKSKRAVYQDPVVRYGFCRGLEPVTYVSYILDRYDHYRQFVVDQPEEELASTDEEQPRRRMAAN